MKVSAQYAQEHFEELATAAENGEQVEIERVNKPALRLVASAPVQAITTPRILGAGRGLIRVPTDEEWLALDEEMDREMNDAPLLTSGEI